MEDLKQKIEALIKQYHEECDEEDYDDFMYRQFLSSGHCDYKTWKYNHECSATHRKVFSGRICDELQFYLN